MSWASSLVAAASGAQASNLLQRLLPSRPAFRQLDEPMATDPRTPPPDVPPYPDVSSIEDAPLHRRPPDCPASPLPCPHPPMILPFHDSAFMQHPARPPAEILLAGILPGLAQPAWLDGSRLPPTGAFQCQPPLTPTVPTTPIPSLSSSRHRTEKSARLIFPAQPRAILPP